MVLRARGLLARLGCCFLLFSWSVLAFAQLSDLNTAINVAGRQRMLTQRMAKAYFQLGQQVEPERSRKILEASAGLFDRQLSQLKAYAPTPELKETYGKLDTLWQTYRGLLVAAPPNLDAGRKVMAMSDEVMELANQGVSQLEKLAGSNAGRLVNLAGRQRMLSQRMAKLYQARAWGIGEASTSAQLDKARQEFTAGLQELGASQANTPQIKISLDLVRQQWFFFENALSKTAGSDIRPQTAVATTSERILEEMDLVVGLYERLGRPGQP